MEKNKPLKIMTNIIHKYRNNPWTCRNPLSSFQQNTERERKKKKRKLLIWAYCHQGAGLESKLFYYTTVHLPTSTKNALCLCGKWKFDRLFKGSCKSKTLSFNRFSLIFRNTFKLLPLTSIIPLSNAIFDKSLSPLFSLELALFSHWRVGMLLTHLSLLSKDFRCFEERYKQILCKILSIQVTTPPLD